MQGELHELFEDLYRCASERVECGIIAHLLRRREYRAAFLDYCRIPWDPGEAATVRCEVPLLTRGRADITVDWHHRGARHLAIEHKPWCGFTPAQPGNYLTHLKQHEARAAGFVLLCTDPSMKETATRRVLHRRALPSASAGSGWGALDTALREEKPGRLMRFRTILPLTSRMLEVESTPAHRELVQIWHSRHADPSAEVPDEDRARVDAIFLALGLEEHAAWKAQDGYGDFLWKDGEGHHDQQLWFGVEPPVAEQLGAADGALLLVQGGYLPPVEAARLDRWMIRHGLTWTVVRSGQWLPERATVLSEPDAVAWLRELARELGLR